MLEMPALPIKSEMSSTSATAADGPGWSSAAYQPVVHKVGDGGKTRRGWSAGIKTSGLLFFSDVPLFLFPSFFPLFCFFTAPLRPLSLPLVFSASVWSFAAGSQQAAVSWQDGGQCAGWLIRRSHTHAHTLHTHTHKHQHTSALISIQRFWSWDEVGRHADAGITSCVHLSCFAVCLPLTLSCCLCLSLYRNSGTEAPPLPRGSNQWSPARARGCLPHQPSLSPHTIFFLLFSSGPASLKTDLRSNTLSHSDN